MSVTIEIPASMIVLQADSGGGSNADSSVEITTGSNSIHEIAGVFYVLVLAGDRIAPGAPRTFQMYRSYDAGVTWASVGSEVTPSKFGGGMNSFVVGTRIHFAYSQRFGGGFSPDQHLFVNYYETAGDTWGTESSFDCGNSPLTGNPFRVEGPYATHQRPDGSLVYVISDTLGADFYAVVYDGSFHSPVRLTPSAPQLYETSLMEADGTVHLFFVLGYDPGVFHHQTFSTSNLAGTPVAVTVPSGEILSWNDSGLMHGFVDGGVFYLAAGRKTASPDIYGKPAILYGNDSGWTLGALLNTDADPDAGDYSVLTCALQSVNGWLIYFWRGESSDGTHFIDRIGYAPVGSHDTPADWTWQTVYRLRDPDPIIDAQAPPYDIPGPGEYGATTGLIQTATETRIVATIRNDISPTNDKLFVAYMYKVSTGVTPVLFGNEFR